MPWQEGLDVGIQRSGMVLGLGWKRNGKDVVTHITLKTYQWCQSANESRVCVCERSLCWCGCELDICAAECQCWQKKKKVQIPLLLSQLLAVVGNCLFTSRILSFPAPSICMFMSLCYRYAVCGCSCLAQSCFTVCQLTSVIFLRDKARSCLYLLVSGSRCECVPRCDSG